MTPKAAERPDQSALPLEKGTLRGIIVPEKA